jgi:hypothetical protein
MKLGYAQVRRIGGESAEPRSEQDTNVPDIDREMQRMKKVVDDTTGRHQTGVDGPANDTAQGVPCSRVEPVPEFLQTLVSERLRRIGGSSHRILLLQALLSPD